MNYEEIPYFRNPEHILKLKNTKVPFRCHGCKEDGIGLRYSCSHYVLHFDCATKFEMISHFFYPELSFQFKSKPPEGKPRYCDACKKHVTGCIYRSTCGVNLHPCCAKLPKVLKMKLDDREVKFSLLKEASTPCLKCEEKGNGWCYSSSCKKRYAVHVACARDMQVENWLHAKFPLSEGGGGKDTLALQKPHNRSKSKRWLKMGHLALQLVISVVLGHPMTLFASVVHSLMS